jgi:glutathione S-transferase
VRADLGALGDDLDRIDGWIAAGVIGGPEPNAADFQLAPSIRLLMSFDDLRPFIEARPCGEMAKRIVTDFPGRTPPIFPAEWLEGLRT